MHTLNRKPSVAFDLFRVLLIPAGLLVAAALILVSLSQSTADRIIGQLQSNFGGSKQAEVAFLYLGHQIQGGRFHIRGVVQNITPDPIEQLDAMIRLYAPNRELLETAIVRMDREMIASDDIARFELVYPDSGSRFSSYSVEFKLRSGKVVPYLDMRESRAKPVRLPAASTQSEK